jgi:hypothetical protein
VQHSLLHAATFFLFPALSSPSQNNTCLFPSLSFYLSKQHTPTNQTQLYNGAPDLKLNEIVTVIGVFSVVPELGVPLPSCLNSMDAAASLLDAETLQSHPPTSQAPRIHAILVAKEGEAEPGAYQAAAALSAEARAAAVAFLSSALGGDDLAGE